MYDPLAIIWVSLWAGIGSFGLYLLYSNDQGASHYYVYGKSLDLKKKKNLFWRLFLLPKSWFIHFYLTSLIIFLISFATILVYYIPLQLYNNDQLIQLLQNLIHLSSKYVNIQKADTLPAITSLVFTCLLMIIQTSRRLYECMFISVYSSNSKINTIHYLYGHMFYLVAALSTVCPILLSQTSSKFTSFNLLDNLVTKNRAFAFLLFVYASHHQHKCHVILANLRKDKTGNVITQKHYVPSGGLFEFVSCPHFLTEIIIYFCILVAQEFTSYYWCLIFLLVITTQTINALTEHRWYKKNYRDYPKERKAIIPRLL